MWLRKEGSMRKVIQKFIFRLAEKASSLSFWIEYSLADVFSNLCDNLMCIAIGMYKKDEICPNCGASKDMHSHIMNNRAGYDWYCDFCNHAFKKKQDYPIKG